MEKDDYAKLWWENRNQWLYELARDTSLKPNSVRIALLFGTFLAADVRETVRPGYGWLMKTSGINSRSTISSCLKELASKGYLSIDKNYHLNQDYSMPFTGDAVWAHEVKVQKMDP